MGRYLITGIAGFIGSSIARALVARGEYVRGIDDFSTGTAANLEDLSGKVEVIRASVCDRTAVERACSGIDYIFHEAAVASVQRSIEDPAGTCSTNLIGTLNMVSAAQNCGVRRIVFASSSAVYGDQPAPHIESATPRPLSSYAVQKLASEFELANAWRASGLETVALRYFNVFGPGQSADSPYSGVIARFSQLMLAWPGVRQAPVICGDGRQARDFVFVDDVVDANLLAMHAPAHQVAGQRFNIGTGQAQSVQRIFAALARISCYHGPVRHTEARSGEVRNSQANIDLARNVLQYTPRIALEEGLERTIAWYRQSSAKQIFVAPPSPVLEHATA